MGTTQSVDTCDVIQTPQEIQFEESEPVLFQNFKLGEQTSAYLSFDGKVYHTGRKIIYKPRLFEIDYTGLKVKDFCSTDKGIGVLTEDNQLFYNGNFWPGKYIDHNIETGVK